VRYGVQLEPDDILRGAGDKPDEAVADIARMSLRVHLADPREKVGGWVVTCVRQLHHGNADDIQGGGGGAPVKASTSRVPTGEQVPMPSDAPALAKNGAACAYPSI
jgi:hypothetical protein